MLKLRKIKIRVAEDVLLWPSAGLEVGRLVRLVLFVI